MRIGLSAESVLARGTAAIESLKLELDADTCGSTDVRAYIPGLQDDIDFFVAGAPVGTMKHAM